MGSRRRWSVLDGLRALAIVDVMIFHLPGVLALPGGFVGVDLFFVLSGFLITRLLAEEHSRYGRIAYARFYVRRALRLFPALWTLIGVTVLAGLLDAALRSQADEAIAATPPVLLYVSNWARLLDPAGPLSHVLGQTWSLAIEEQFYLVWPWVLALLLARTTWVRAGRFLVGLAACDLVYTEAVLLAGWSPARAYAGTDTHAFGLLLGSALALLTARRPAFRLPLGLRSALALGGLAGLLTLSVTWPAVSEFGGTPALEQLAMPGASLAAAALIGGLLAGPVPLLTAILESRVARWIGTRSYGLYLWHLWIFREMGSFVAASSPLIEPLRILVTLAVAATSYRLIESPFLRLKGRYEPGPLEDRRSRAATERGATGLPSRLPVAAPASAPGAVGGREQPSRFDGG